MTPPSDLAVAGPDTPRAHESAEAWAEALAAATLFAVDPRGTAGVRLRAAPGPARDAWLAALASLLPESESPRRIPAGIADDRLLGGLDLAATLAAGRPIALRGLLAELDGGVGLLAMAERMPPGQAARLAATLDSFTVALERDGIAATLPARLGLVALDEGIDDEAPPQALCDRLAFSLDLAPLPARNPPAPVHARADVAAARALLPRVNTPDPILAALVSTAATLGIASLRAPLLALRAARAAAALDGRTEVDEADAQLAARLVLAPRATRLPAMEDDQPPDAEEPPPDPPPPEDAASPEDERQQQGELSERVLEAAQAALPADLLAQLALAAGRRGMAQSQGRAGQFKLSLRHGRPVGSRPGELRGGARLHVLDTLKAAAPWQRLRQSTAPAPDRVHVRRGDFRIRRYRQRIGTTTIFVVDASGSAALQRLAEAKGAVELLLADCYVRRDKVALIAFRGPRNGQAAELLLPPTSSLVRAKRSLAALPGGGGTPLASGIDAAATLAEAVARGGQTPIVALLTDGRANIGRDGTPGRPQAEQDALAAGRRLAATGVTCLLLDISAHASPQARALAAAMGARYLPLPRADAAAVSRAVQAMAGD